MFITNKNNKGYAMKKILYTLILVSLAIILLTSCGKSEYTYEKVENGVAITGYTGDATHIIIPEKIGRKNVVAIGESAFDATRIISVVVPDSVKTIEKYAFRRCGNLTNIVLPKGLNRIEEGTFTFCSALQKIDIPNGVEYIGTNAFAGTALSKVTLPDSVKVVGDYVFYNCTHLTSFKAGKGLEELGKYAFANCISLKSPELNEGLKKMGNNCFEHCSSMTEFDIPAKVETLEMGLFAHSAIENITIAGGVKKISYYVFEGCKSLNNVYISPSVNEMDSNIFNECKGFVIHGVRDSQAEIYADTYGFKFQEYNFE